LLISSASLAISANLYKKLPFNPATDLLPISHLVSAEGHVLSVTPSLPVQNVKELIALGRRPDSKLGYGSPGVGAAVHLKAALFNSKMGMHMFHVPYKGGGPMLNALMAGEVQVMFINPSSGLALIKSGKIRALAYDSDTRAPFLPDVPSMVEAGASPTQLDASWHGLFAPARVPASVVARLESEIRKAYALPEFREQFVKLGLIPIGDSSHEFKPFVANAFKQFREATQAAGIEPE
jgi:tripartite-type tricarboxylate transporter receptor subunit TctC